MLTPLSLRTVPDHVLLRTVRELALRDACLEADLLVHIGEIDARALYAAQGFPSLFAFCTEALHFSEAVAFHRIAAARAARTFPAVLERVRAGELHLSGVQLLAPHLTRENHAELLARAKHKSKRAIEAMLADLAPKPDVPPMVRAVPQPAEARPAKAESPTAPPAPVPVPVLSAPTTAERPSRHAEPLGAERYAVAFTASREAHAKLLEAQALLRHRIPDGDLAKIFECALDALLREVRRSKFAEADRPREARSSEGPVSRHIPAAIRRVVRERDRSRCTFVSSDGRACGSRELLEFHHTTPFARSRRHDAAGIVLRCRTHNRHAAVQDFGAEHMARFQRGKPRQVPTAPGGSCRN